MTLFIALLLLLQTQSINPFQGSEYNTARQYTSRDGLASDVVHYVHQGVGGYLWFATDSGINRFDGHRFKHFTTVEGLGGNEVFRIFEDSRGRLWFLSFNGIPSFYHNGAFFNPSNYQALAGIRFRNSLSSIMEDRHGHIWIGSETGEIVRITDTHHQLMFPGGAPPGQLIQLWQLDNGRTFVGTSAGIFEIHEDQNNFTPFHNAVIASIRNDITNDGTFIFALRTGIWLMDQQANHRFISNNQLQTSHPITSVRISPSNTYLTLGTNGGGFYAYRFNATIPELIGQFFSGMAVSSVHFDNEMSVWVSSNRRGVFRIDDGYSSFRVIDQASGLSSNNIHRLFISSENHIWVSAADGSLYAWDSELRLLWKTMLETAEKVPDVAEQFFEWKPGRILVGGVNGIYEIRRSGSRTQPFSVSLKVGPPGYYVIKDIASTGDTLYLASNRGLHQVIDEKWDEVQLLFNNRLTNVEVAPNGRVYVGTVDGLFEWNGAELISTNIPKLGNIQINQLKHLFRDWIGISTSGKGAVLLCTSTGEWHALTITEGLTSNMVTAIDYDERGSLWIATNNGLNRIRFDIEQPLLAQLEEIDIIVYNNADGLKAGPIRDMLTDRAGHAWIAGNSGISVMRTDYMGYPPVVIPVLIDEILVNGKNTAIQSEYDVDHRQSDWEITFSGIFFRDADRIIYRYRMQGLDQSWNETQANRVIYRSLPPGNYIFEVEAFTSDGRVSSPLLQTRILIRAAIWQQAWFQFLGLAVILVGITGFIRLRVNALRTRDRENRQTATQIAELEYQALQSMMNPHFIFNVLNSIRYNILLMKPDRASDMLTDFSHLIRLQLDSSYKRKITLYEEIERLKLYIKLESERISRPVTTNLVIEDDIDIHEIWLPALILQPFVENAIIHGITPLEEREGHIDITLRRVKDRQIQVSITDNGVGLKSPLFIARTHDLLRQLQFNLGEEFSAEDIADMVVSVVHDTSITKRAPVDSGNTDSPHGSTAVQRLSLGLRLVSERLRLLGADTAQDWFIAIVNKKNENNGIIGVSATLLLPIK